MLLRIHIISIFIADKNNSFQVFSVISVKHVIVSTSCLLSLKEAREFIRVYTSQTNFRIA